MRITLFLALCAFSSVSSLAQGLTDRDSSLSLLRRGITENKVGTTIREPFNPSQKAYAIPGQTLPKGIRVLRSFNKDYVIVAIPTEQEWNSLIRQGIQPIAVNDYWKLSPELAETVLAAKQDDQQQSYLVELSDPKAFTDHYIGNRNISFSKVSGQHNIAIIRTSFHWLEKHILQDTMVRFIARQRQPVVERELTGFDLSANAVNAAHRLWPDIDGRGLTVSIKEEIMDTVDIDFKGRYKSSPDAAKLMQAHATTMTTIIAGGGNTYFTGTGVARGSQFSSSDFANLLPDNDANLTGTGISVQNHSYGTGIENFYGADARAYDQQVNALPYLVHVFSAGNSGSLTSTSGPYAGIEKMANLTGSFKMAKNVILVAAMDSIGNIPAAISRGPAYDGRLKPELVAFGEDGSSGAAALVSGFSLLIQQSYRDKHGQLPSAALVKSILASTATDIGARGIDFASGYGAVNAVRAIALVKKGQYHNGMINTGQQDSYRLTIPENIGQARIVLSWLDPAALTNSNTALVNDLDLELVNELTGEIWQPWVLNSTPSLDALTQLATRKRDSLNNTEMISLDIPAAGNYLVKIRANNLATNLQAYALSWHFDTLNTFQFTFPVKGDNLLPGKRNTLRWQSGYNGTGQLEYQLNNSGSWQSMDPNVDLSTPHYKWQAPDQFASITFRMTIGANTYHSDTVSISNNLLIRTGFNCVDSFLIYWQKAPTAVQGYRLYRLGDRYLEPFTELTDTALVQYASNNPYEYFTVAPILANGVEAEKAYTFNYKTQQTGCYIRNFLADAGQPNEARLTLELGTTYSVKKIGFEQLTKNGFIELSAVSPVVTFQNITTTFASNGLNIFRAYVELENGTRLYTPNESVYQFNENPYYVFPNPVNKGQSLRVMVEDPEGTSFVLYDINGRLLFQQRLSNTIQSIDLSRLQAGIYIYTIIKDGQRQLTKKLVIQ
ncbi:S8 family peptidase [Flavihumibacter rivuli]|uniref:S8 family peptidase n=1 Tax=Flavihumibacter rivuli TaxID=2838156 RepID=UPI001EFBC31D|nr:S8 family peptidase [Flavihumibacter rivuli]ULQ58442.1 S8 family peptidase [Flavihumibacter rivuli]